MERDELVVRAGDQQTAVGPDFLEKFSKALKDLTVGASGVPWTFTSISLNSPLRTAARPNVGTDAEAVQAFDNIVRGLSEIREARFPKGWTREAVRALHTLGSVESTQIGIGKRLELQSVGRFAENAKVLLEVELPSIGSVEGIIDSAWLRPPNRRFGLIDEGTGDSVQINFASHLESRVLEFLKARVRVCARGRLFRDASGRKMRLTLEKIDALETPTQLSVRDVMGTLGQLPEGIDSVEWVRRQRD